jgi:hypothetical protein
MQAHRFHRDGAVHAEAGTAAVAEGGPDCKAAGEASADSRRARLYELDPYIHVSVIGTCLSRADLHEIVARFAGLDTALVSDFELHHAAVQIAAEGGHGAAALHDMLDSRYEREIRRFKRARDQNELLQWWSVGRRNGETAGAYWALMTHPRATGEFRRRIVGEVHGLTYRGGGEAPSSE